jgi:D-hexose-6-phosphate mutarotase
MTAATLLWAYQTAEPRQRVVWTPWNHDSQNLESSQERSIRKVITCEQRAADFDMRLITGT